MDVKSLAKSKRAHSQHHSKKHHSKPTTVKAPTPGGGASTANKQSGKGVGEKSGQSQSSKGLSSNRDRYDEVYDSDVYYQSNSSINLANDGFVPKSKGADYKYLLSEAKLQSDANISSESFPSFDDIFSDFNEGFGSLLSARGESILSWTGDDNFIVEDKTTSSHEASFLSLNLHLLAEQLEKVDLPTRLFIEPDLFLAEMSSENIRTTDEGSDQVHVAHQSQDIKNKSDQLIDDHPNKDNLKDGEAEVDLLPDSFSNTKFFNSSDPKKYNDILSGQQEETDFKKELTSILNKAPGLNSQRDSDLVKSDAVAISFDDDLDDLLKETSPSLLRSISSVQPVHSQPWFKGPDFSEPASSMKNFDDDLDDLLVDTLSNTKNAQVLSKTASATPKFDEELDVLLEVTSSRKGTLQSHEVGSSQRSHTSSSESKLSVLDEFDSLFETF